MEIVSVPNLDIQNVEDPDLFALLIKILKPQYLLPDNMNTEKFMFFIAKLYNNNVI